MASAISCVSFILFWINLIVFSTNIYFSIKVYKADAVPYTPYKQYNLRGTKERLLIQAPNYYLEKEIETPKVLRNLATNNLKLSLVIINACSALFLFTFMFTFCVGDDECSDEGICIGGCCVCCASCVDCCCRGDCRIQGNCSSGNNNGEGAIGLCILLLIVLIFVGLFYLVKACGKEIARIISIIALFLTNGALLVLALDAGTDKFNVLLASFSGFAALCNLILIILGIYYNCCVDCECCISCCLSSNGYNIINEPKNNVPVIQPVQSKIPSYQQLNEIKPKEQDEYPDSKDFMYYKPTTPDYNETNQGNNNNYTAPTPYDAPAPVYQQQNYNVDNQGNISYPSPQ